MFRSKLCWQLFLGWALLVGQSVWGTKKECCDHQERDEPELGLEEELDEPEPTAEEELEESQQDFEKRMRLLDEMLEEQASADRQQLQSGEPDDNKLLRHLEDVALNHFNKHSDQPFYYEHFNDRHLFVRKAIGNMVAIRLLLTKTSCKKDLANGGFDPFWHERHCKLHHEYERQTLDCRFVLFLNAWTLFTSRTALVDRYDCMPLHLKEEKQ